MTILEAYCALTGELGPQRNVLIDAQVAQYTHQHRPTIHYRIHLWTDSKTGQPPAFCYCEQSPDLGLLVERALDALRSYRDTSLPCTSPELVRASAGVA